jgi:hypothetical protein
MKQEINNIEMPAVVARFFEATKNYDERALFATFARDIKLKDEGKLVSSEDLVKWNSQVFFGVDITLQP